MSFVDALLLDPLKLDVWFAVRTDGVKGSGTENDPYNASPRLESALPVTTLTASGRKATVSTGTTNHGYSDHDAVTIAGVTGPDAALYNGTFPISVLSATSFTYWMKAPPGANASGAMTCARTNYPFDEIRGTPPLLGLPVAIRLGPGVFQTRGVNDVTGGVGPSSGQKVIGSGMGVTTLKLVNASQPNSQYRVIGTTGHLEYFELSDLTLDCNLDGQLIGEYTFPPIACSGVAVNGAHLRYRRIRVINFGELRGGVFEGFVMWSAGADPAFSLESVDCVIEYCILEQPAINQYGLVTVINMGATERLSDGIMGYHRACVVRNCLIDCEYKLNPVRISRITFSGTTATVTTVASHGRSANDWVRIAGALVNGSAANPFNGSVQITNVTSTTFQYTMASTPSAAPTGDMWVDRFSSHYVAITSISKSPTGPPYTITVTTSTPHFRVPGNNVFVNNVGVTGMTNGFNGSFEVTAVDDPWALDFQTQADPGNPLSSQPNAFIGMTFQGISNDGGTASVVEGNRIYNTRIGGPYHDFYSSKDLTCRNNHYRSVATGPYQQMGGVSPLKAGVSLTHAGLTATFTTQANHGLVAGQSVRVDGAKINDGQGHPIDPPIGSYNGFYPIASAAATSFSYLMLVDPQADALSSPAPTFGAVWQEGRLIIEINVIELIGTINNWGSPVGIEHFLLASIGSQYAMRQAVIRGNIIRHVDDVADPTKTPLPLGIRVVSYENVIIEDNVIDLVSTAPVQHSGSKNVEVFNNMTPAGSLIQGYDATNVKKDDELATKIEDVQLLGF